MPIEGVDYSWARPDPVKLAAAGKLFACRYVSSSTKLIGGHTKNLSRAEADALHAAGVATVTNWEWSATDAVNGYSTGAEYARRAKQMHADCGGPPDAPIYFSVDYDTRPLLDKSLETIRQYFLGITSVLGKARTGIYGGYHVVGLAHDGWGGEGRWCDWYWQTYAWSSGRWHSYNHIEQYNNGEIVAGTGGIDLDRGKVIDYGQWGVDDVALTTEEHNWLENVYLADFYGGLSCGREVDPDGGGIRPPANSFVAKLDYAMGRLDTILAAVGKVDEATVAGLLTGLKPTLDAILAAAVASTSTVTMSAEDRAALAGDLTKAVLDAASARLAA
jgi:hypothetical protein